jgi:hypothetical protein
MAHAASIYGRRSPTFAGTDRMEQLFPTLSEKQPALSPGYVKRAAISRGIAADLQAKWRRGSVKRWPLRGGAGPLLTNHALRGEEPSALRSGAQLVRCQYSRFGVEVRLRAGRAWELEVIFATLRLLINRLSPTTRKLA